MYQILSITGSRIKPRKHARVGLVPWNILPLFILFYRAPSLNNAVNIISVSQSLITMAERPPEAEYRLCWFYRFFLLVLIFFQNCLTLLLSWYCFRTGQNRPLILHLVLTMQVCFAVAFLEETFYTVAHSGNAKCIFNRSLFYWFLAKLFLQPKFISTTAEFYLQPKFFSNRSFFQPRFRLLSAEV